MNTWLHRLQNMLIKKEPELPAAILGEKVRLFKSLPTSSTICIKVSAAHELPYPFAVSESFVAKVIQEIQTANSSLKITLTEGGVGKQSVVAVAERLGLTEISNVKFVDAESTDTVYVANPNPKPYREEGFWLPIHWMEADIRILLTTCKLRSHHFQRWYSGGTRNLLGLLPRSKYKLSTSKRNMRSAVHQRGMDAMVADLYAASGQNVLTILDGRLIARQDEHIPLRFTRSLGQIVIADDPWMADEQLVETLKLSFTPPYLKMISKYKNGIKDPLVGSSV